MWTNAVGSASLEGARVVGCAGRIGAKNAEGDSGGRGERGGGGNGREIPLLHPTSRA